MASGFPRVTLTETDLSQSVDNPQTGISYVEGITEKGSINKPQLISSAIQFERIFGGELKTSDFPLIVKRALSYGVVLLVSRIAHYTDITDASSLTALNANIEIKDKQ